MPERPADEGTQNFDKLDTMSHTYPDLAPPHQRYQYCPLCACTLRDDRDEVNGLPRPTCPACGWIYYPPNTLGALAIVHTPDGLAVIHPPECDPAAPTALPGGIVEYGEPPEECAAREVREETGLEVRITAQLCRFFDRDSAGAPLPFGPMLHFGFLAEAVGGTLRDGDEGPARTYPPDRVPPIAPTRAGSRRVYAAYQVWLESSA